MYTTYFYIYTCTHGPAAQAGLVPGGPWGLPVTHTVCLSSIPLEWAERRYYAARSPPAWRLRDRVRRSCYRHEPAMRATLTLAVAAVRLTKQSG